MYSPFYQYPIRATRLMQAPLPGQPADEHPTCALRTSIAQLLHLLLHTRPGQLRCAPHFGCAVWDLEFDNNVELARWEDTLSRSLLTAVQQHELRLSEVSVRVSLSPVGLPGRRAAEAAARWCAQVSISGTVRLTHEAFSYDTRLLVGQLAT